MALTNLASLTGVLGGAAVLALFPASTALFGAYGIGLLLGFLSYLAVLAWLVRMSTTFTVDWFLDGRRKKPTDDEEIPITHGPPAPRCRVIERSRPSCTLHGSYLIAFVVRLESSGRCPGVMRRNSTTSG